MSTDSTTLFEQHDLDRAGLLATLAELNLTRAFNSTSLSVSENFSSLCLRLEYVLTDLTAMAHVLLIVDDGVRAQTERLSDSKTPVELRIKRHIAAASYEIPAIDRLAVVYKALFFTLRSLQDIEYAILLELVGQRAGSGTSMSKCFKAKDGKPSNNPILSLIKINIPLYESWFLRFRNIRNELKTGRGHGLTSSSGQIKVSLSLQEGNVSAVVYTVGLPDIVEAVEMSSSLFKLMKSLCQNLREQENSAPLRT